MVIDEEKTFKEILKRKIDYYGETEAAYELAAEEYARFLVQQDLIDAAGDAFDAGMAFEYGLYEKANWGRANFYPDKETYLKTLTQK